MIHTIFLPIIFNRFVSNIRANGAHNFQRLKTCSCVLEYSYSIISLETGLQPSGLKRWGCTQASHGHLSQMHYLQLFENIIIIDSFFTTITTRECLYFFKKIKYITTFAQIVAVHIKTFFNTYLTVFFIVLFFRIYLSDFIYVLHYF